MPLPVPNLDDRRFDDLVAESKARLAAHLPELTQVSPGDPVHTVIDLFSWLTETILYRANLIPERQRRIFLNLLQIPLRPAIPAKGVVCIDAGPTSIQLPSLVKDGTQLRAGQQPVTVLGEIQPTPLTLQVLIKQALSTDDLEALGMTLNDLHEQYGLRKGETPKPYQPKRLIVGQDIINLTPSLDKSVYLAAIAPKQLEGQLGLLRDNLAGIRLNVALAPADNVEGDAVTETSARALVWELISLANDGSVRHLPLEQLSDTSLGGRQVGVVRLQLPKNSALFRDFANADPMFDGTKAYPPALDDAIEAQRVAFWIRMRSPDEPDLQLGYIGLNGIDVVAQGMRTDRMVGLGSGHPDQVVALPDAHVDTNTLALDVEDRGTWVRWQAVDQLANQGGEARVFRLNRETGLVYFGDGQRSGMRPPVGAGIRIASYRYGGGTTGNLPAGTIKEIVNGQSRHKLRHEWPLKGGVNAETVEEAERRIPTFLTHRNRAVTAEDFQLITRHNPINPVARAEVIPGFIPGATLDAANYQVPGAVSLFVLPPAERVLGNTPKPTKGLLKDVFEYVSARTLVGTELYVLSPMFIPVAVSLVIQVLDAKTEQTTIQAVKQAMVDYLWLLAPGGAQGRGWAMGKTVRANELLTQAARVAGVLSVNPVALFAEKDGEWKRVSASEGLLLEPYQLPDLQGVGVVIGQVGDTPALPGGLKGGDGSSDNGVAVPVIPEVC
ncbi:putative baseplate assembly protein [Hahella sp. CCB-MM4]|uniref:baseplate J/gp47 family protein n=1 Tax=Hahella sp. (strain CCB-MM4) TaxID=1926491 RepID=UPI000B9B0AD2|nr:baseplate J/gp47 family protein [Hahella sp. CCB-MM4]OZG70296.1 putative baseplate assembly protein [Hahella sp. CCB-MM4]